MDQASLSAAVDGLDTRALRIETPCGDGRMVWRVWGDGSPLVLLHGGYGSWLHWIRNIPALAARHRVYAADLPGLGESDLAPPPESPGGIAAVVAAGLDALGLAPEATDLVGFSFGALIGSHVALARPGLRSLTLVGAGALGTARRSIMLERTDGDLDAAGQRDVHRRNLALLMIADPARIDDLAVDIQAANVARARVRSRRFATSTATADALRDAAFGRLHAVWGEHDAVAAGGFDERRALLTAIRPETTFDIVPDAGHWLPYEAPEAFDRLLLERLGG